MRPLRHRFALALVALAWLAQQLGFATHSPMQIGAALAGPFGEVCTSAGLVPAPSDPASPSEHRTQGAGGCDLCIVASLPALDVAPLLGPAAAQREPGVQRAPSSAPTHDLLRRANRSRAPPLLLA